MTELSKIILSYKGNEKAHDIKNKLCYHISYLTFDSSKLEKQMIKSAYTKWIDYYVTKKNFDVITAQELAFKNLGGNYEI